MEDLDKNIPKIVKNPLREFNISITGIYGSVEHPSRACIYLKQKGNKDIIERLISLGWIKDHARIVCGIKYVYLEHPIKEEL